MPAVKIGASRQVAIPKKLHDQLGLSPGDYLEVELDKGKLVLTPKALVNKEVEKRLAESFEDFRQRQVHGPFSSAKETMRSLRGGESARLVNAGYLLRSTTRSEISGKLV